MDKIPKTILYEVLRKSTLQHSTPQTLPPCTLLTAFPPLEGTPLTALHPRSPRWVRDSSPLRGAVQEDKESNGGGAQIPAPDGM